MRRFLAHERRAPDRHFHRRRRERRRVRDVSLAETGFIAPYKSPQAAGYPEGFKDPNGYWTDLYDNLIVTAFNTTRVKREEIPKRYEDLLQPRWKGRMVLDQNEDRWFATWSI